MNTQERAAAAQAAKEQVIAAFAQYLAGNSAGKSVAIECERLMPAPPHLNYPKWGEEWAQIRIAFGITGWATEDEVIEKLKKILA